MTPVVIESDSQQVASKVEALVRDAAIKTTEATGVTISTAAMFFIGRMERAGVVKPLPDRPSKDHR